MSFLRRLFGSKADDAEVPAAGTTTATAWSATGEGPFDVEKIPGEWHFQISFDDEIAHEEEDRVTAFVELLGRERGVDQAVHEDREVVLVKARGLSPEAMQATAERVWAAAQTDAGEE